MHCQPSDLRSTIQRMTIISRPRFKSLGTGGFSACTSPHVALPLDRMPSAWNRPAPKAVRAKPLTTAPPGDVIHWCQLSFADIICHITFHVTATSPLANITCRVIYLIPPLTSSVLQVINSHQNSFLFNKMEKGSICYVFLHAPCAIQVSKSTEIKYVSFKLPPDQKRLHQRACRLCQPAILQLLPHQTQLKANRGDFELIEERNRDI